MVGENIAKPGHVEDDCAKDADLGEDECTENIVNPRDFQAECSNKVAACGVFEGECTEHTAENMGSKG